MSVEDLVESVRGRIRQEGFDPRRHPDRVQEVIQDVIADQSGYLSRSDNQKLLIEREVLGMGALQALLDDPGIEEIWINAPDRIFIARGGVSELTTLVLSVEQVQELVERILVRSGRRLDLSSPFVDAQLPDGSRLHVAIPDITPHFSVNIRKHVAPLRSINDLVSADSLTTEAAAFLQRAIEAGLNILVSGGTHTGKTTLLNCLLSLVPAKERIVTVEEVFELRIDLPDVVSMQTRQANLEGTGEIPLRRLITESLRMRPSRIVVGEVRGAEALDLLIAMNSGLPGLASIHANSARDAITKICTLPLLAGPNVTHHFVVPTVAASVDLIIHCLLEPSGRRSVGEIRAVYGQAEEHVIQSQPLFLRRTAGLERMIAEIPAPEKFQRHGIRPWG